MERCDYLVRQSFLFQGVYLNNTAVFHLMKEHEAYQALPRKVSNQVLLYPSVEDAVDIASALAVTDITNDIGDFTMWVPLYECFCQVMLDLFNWDKRASPLYRLRKQYWSGIRI